jgi:hypothetical protein
MKPFCQLFLAGFLFLVSWPLTAQISIGGYNVYYGHLHNHTSNTDGTGTPDQAYSTAKANGLDFFGLAEHSNALTTTEWSDTQAAADANYLPGVFTTFRGFEWTTSNYGHVAVINTPSLILTSDTNYDTFTELVGWLNIQPSDCFAFFNHPGDYNSAGTEFDHFSTALVTDKIVGMEQWNKTNGFSKYYASSTGVAVAGFFAGDGMAFYDEALQRGWKVAPEGSEDNHVATWGAMTTYKTAVLSNANTRTDLTAAFNARRFFTTNDLNVALSFKINGNEMGSTVLPGTYSMQIQCSDGNSETYSKVELMKNGVVVTTWTPGTTNVDITQPLTCANGEYYYIRVYQADALTAFSSPVWINTGIANVYPSVNITNPATASTYTAPASMNITANASDSDGSIAKVEFFQGTTKLGEDTTSPYSFSWSNIPAGTYVITAKATDNLGAFTTSASVTIGVYDPALPNTVSCTIATGSDDAEESNTGTMYLTSTDIELVNDAGTGAGDQVVGLRFTNLLIPRGAHISSSYIQFTCDEVNSDAASLTIKGEAVDNSSTFTTTAGSISARAKTTASVSWIPAAWQIADVAGADQRTPELATIIQEIVDRSGFTSASALSIIITGTGSRVAEAYEGVPASAAKLFVVFTQTSPVVPTFNPIGPLCQNSAPPALPLVSTNGISGTWSPSVITTISAGSTVCTFTPNAGEDATTATLTISVNPTPSAPVANVTQPNCSTATGIITVTSPTGTGMTYSIGGAYQSSAIFSGLVPGSYTVTAQNAGGCISAGTIVTINAQPATPMVTNSPLTQTITSGSNTTLVTLISNVTGTTFVWTATATAGVSGFTASGTSTIPVQTISTSGTTAGTVTCAIIPTASGCQGQVTNYIITVNPATVTYSLSARISTGTDDVEQYANGTMLLNSDDIELVYDSNTTGNQTVGLRFRSITIPQGAVITKAYIQFTADEVTTAAASHTIKGQDVDNAAVFTTSKKNVSNRIKTTASVSWVPSTWPTVGASGTAQQTPELKTIVQEIVSRTGWVSGSSMVFIITGTGKRTAESYEGLASGAALLYVEYTLPSVKAATIPSSLIFSEREGQGKLSCYPVPFSNVLNIIFEPADNEVLHNFAIYSISGNLMKKIQTGNTELSLGFGELSPGIYLLEAQTNCNRYIKTIVKK